MVEYGQLNITLYLFLKANSQQITLTCDQLTPRNTWCKIGWPRRMNWWSWMVRVGVTFIMWYHSWALLRLDGALWSDPTAISEHCPSLLTVPNGKILQEKLKV